MTKRQSEMRWEMKRVLSNLDARWSKAAQGELVTHLTELLDQLSSRPVTELLAWSSYVPGTPDLTPLLSKELGRRQIYLSRSGGEGGLLFLRIGQDFGAEQAIAAPDSAHGWGAPFTGERVMQSVALIPGLAFDAFGGRLGRGVGEYDRFFARSEMRPILKLGVCWSFQLCDEVPGDSDNVVVDYVVHERGIVDVQQALRSVVRG